MLCTCVYLYYYEHGWGTLVKFGTMVLAKSLFACYILLKFCYFFFFFVMNNKWPWPLDIFMSRNCPCEIVTAGWRRW